MVMTRTKSKKAGPVGTSVQRVDVLEKVTGAAIYTDDIQFGNGLLYARVKRSPHPHALIKTIDVSKAKALPGVKAVVTGADFPERLGLYLKDKCIFAADRVRFIGEAVAAVAAVSEEIAEQALDLIEVEYEVLPAVFDPIFGASPEAPLLHPDLGNYERPNFIFPEAGTNISNHFKVRKGDTEEAFKHCAAIVEHTFTSSTGAACADRNPYRHRPTWMIKATSPSGHPRRAHLPSATCWPNRCINLKARSG